MRQPSYVYVTYIATTPEKLWHAITDADLSARYWGHANVSDWRASSPWEHRRIDGSREADIVGTVVESDPPRRLVMSWASPGEADQPEKVSRVTFAIEPHKEGSIKLVVTHSELEAGSSMERGITQGWPWVLSSLKSFLETGKGLPL